MDSLSLRHCSVCKLYYYVPRQIPYLSIVSYIMDGRALANLPLRYCDAYIRKKKTYLIPTYSFLTPKIRGLRKE
jgi:hypothetical protein